MYFNILKKDLKRKKTMNVIVLLFIILATMFVSSSVNNIVTITQALDHFFDIAGVSDYFIATKQMGADDGELKDVLDNADCIQSYGVEQIIYLNQDEITFNGMELDMKGNAVMNAFDSAQIKFFDSNNKVITSVKEGVVLLPERDITSNNLKVGDSIEISVAGVSVTLKIAGNMKDAFLGSDMMGMSRMLLNQKDYDRLVTDRIDKGKFGAFYYIKSNDTEAVEQILSKLDSNIIFMGDRGMLSTTYAMEMVVAGALLVVSVCLILIAFLVLRFTIAFILNEEYREIGVMKAIGIRNAKIRGLYIVKYLAMAIVGAVIGLFLGMPFGSMLLEKSSKTIVMESDHAYFVNILCAVLVVAIVILFCYGCTRKVKKFSPIDAIRNGSTGERYRSKGLLRLSKSKLHPVSFLSINDILSNLKRYVIMLLTFTISLLLVIIIINTINTLQSNELAYSFSLHPSDIYIENTAESMKFMVEGGHEMVEERLKDIEELLEENDIPCDCSMEMAMKLSLKNGDYSTKSLVIQGTGTTTEDYKYIEGTPPQNTKEVAISGLVAKKLHAEIGDKITISMIDGQREYIVSAIFQTMNNMGEGVRIHQSDDVNYSQAMGSFAYQVDYTDHPSNAQRKERLKTIRELFDGLTIYNGGEYINYTIGGVATIVKGVRRIVVLIVLLICVLVSILMERSFIAKEVGEIGILKAVGFRNKVIVRWHTIRIGLILILSTVIAVVISTPLTKLSSGQVFKMMGAYSGVEFEIKPLEAFVECPLLVFVVTLIAVFLTAQYTRRISAAESSNVE